MNKEKALKNQGLEFREDIAVEGGKLVLLINSDKKSKKRAHQMKLFQKYFASCFRPRRMLSRTYAISTK